MRVSIDKRDPGYRAYSSIYQIKLNGEVVTHVVTADEEKGYVRRYKLDDDSRPIVHSDGKHLVLETVEGRVEVVVTTRDNENLATPKVAVERGDKGAIQVLVYSRMRPGFIRRAVLDDKTFSVRPDTSEEAFVAIFAGSNAEYLCKTYGDHFDPSDCAKAAEDAYRDMIAREANPLANLEATATRQ